MFLKSLAPFRGRPLPLQSREFRDSTVMPYRRGEVRGTWEMGVFESSGRCIPETLTRHRHLDGRESQLGFPGDFGPASGRHEGTAIYLGPLLEHFGHFLLESLARIWFAKRHPELPVVWSCRTDSPMGATGEARLTSWQREILELLGVTNPAILVEAPTRFEHLIIPELGYRFQHSFHPEQAEALAVVPHRPTPGQKLWLSRSKLSRLQNLSMPEVEDRLAGLGWTIVYPEMLAIRDQMARFATAERIAGEQGSALHNLVFLKDPQGLRVDVFLGDPEQEKRPAARKRNINFEIIASTKGIDQRMHLISSEVVTHRRKDMHIRVKKHSTNIGEYFEKLEEAPRAAISPTAGLQPVSQDRRPPNRATITATRINRLAALRGARRYLEVGVARGQTFLNVEIELKHGVDPAFRFDTRPLESERVRFFAMTSDRFFTEAAPRDMRYDIIFLDGLHTFEQTFRDFCASMPHAHADTVWIIDDVFPSDVFSALPSQQDALAFRKQHGLTGTLWHGDVFKCVFAINDFFPNFSFRTLRRTHGNPQTVIVNRPRPDFRPVFNDLEKISRLDYYGFWENRRLLRLDSEDAIFDWLDATLKPA